MEQWLESNRDTGSWYKSREKIAVKEFAAKVMDDPEIEAWTKGMCEGGEVAHAPWCIAKQTCKTMALSCFGDDDLDVSEQHPAPTPAETPSPEETAAAAKPEAV